VALEPQSAEALYGLGLAYAETGRTADVQMVAKQLRDVQPALAAKLAALAPR
jgi:hypothetical protein